MILNTIKYSSIFLLLLSGFVIKGCNPYSLPENRFSKGETAFTVYQESLEQFRAGNFTEAQALITRAIKMNPGVAYFHELDGDIFRAQGNFERALKSYDRATALRSNYPEVYSSQAEIYIALNQHEEAIKSYKKILANDPMQLGAYLNIAEQYMELNEYVVALNSLADYRRLKLAYNETEEPLYYKIRAHIFYRQKKYEEAISDLVQYTKLEPENLEGLELLGICYYRIGKFESGLQYFNRLIRLDEDNGKWYLYRGIYFYKKQDLNDAEGQFRFALDLDPSLFTAHYYLGKIYEERGELQSALEELRLYRQYMPAALGEDVDEPVPGIMFD